MAASTDDTEVFTEIPTGPDQCCLVEMPHESSVLGVKNGTGGSDGKKHETTLNF